MKKEESLLQKFERELKERVLLKTSPSVLPEKVLVDAFKYFDLNKSNKCDFKNFLQVIRMKIGITTLSDDDLDEVFSLYSKQGPEINYRELVNTVFESQIAYSITEKMSKKDSIQFPQLKFDLAKHEEAILKNIDYIIYKLRSSSISAFFKLYYELSLTMNEEGGISVSNFHMTLKKQGIEISGDEISKIFMFMSNEKPMMSLDNLLDYLIVNYSDERLSLVKNAFARMDYMLTQKTTLQLVKELFNPKNALLVKEGKITADEMNTQFDNLTNMYCKYNSNSFIITEVQFYDFFSFISAYIKEDKEFYQFVEYCFKYSELPRPNVAKEPSIRNQYDTKGSVLDDISLQNSALEDLTAVLISQLNGKGDRAYIMFYKVLKCNDFDSDGKLYEKEFEKSINETRLNFSKKQIQRLFGMFSPDKQKLDINNFINLLVPQFDSDTEEIVSTLFAKLFQAPSQSQTLPKTANLSYDQIINTFNPRLHPDFKKGTRADYELKSEFEECLKTFLGLHSGTHLFISQSALLRFFEFYGRNWDYDYFDSIAQSAFKLKAVQAKSEFSRPYGTSIDSDRSNNSPGTQPQRQNTDSGIFKFFDEYSKKVETKPPKPFEKSTLLAHEEYQKSTTPSNYIPNDEKNILIHKEDAFKKKPIDYKVEYPYHTGEAKKGGANENQQTPDYPQKVNKRIIEVEPDAESVISNKPRSTESKFSPSRREKLDPAQGHQINSPEDGSVASPDKNFKFMVDLNDQLERTSVRGSVAPTKNFDYLQKKLRDNIKSAGNFNIFLQLELDMTQQADSKGNIDFEIFSVILEKYDLVKNFKQQEVSNLFVSYLAGEDKMHVQKFANTSRGQMSKRQEDISIEIYDRITPPDVELTLPELKNGFLPQKFKYGAYRTMTESKEMFNNMVNLFTILNLEIKHKNTFDLDDFLYMMDNFAFFISAEDEFSKIVGPAFK